MDLVDPALLADMIFHWQNETPLCGFPDGIDNLNPRDHSHLLDAMLVDIDLPEIIPMIPEPPSSHPAIATPISSLLWPACDSAPPNVSDIFQAVALTENIVKFPLIGQTGATFDVSLEKASESTSPQSACAPFTPPPAVKQTRRASKREPKSKAKVSETSRKRVIDGEQVEENRAPNSRAEHIIRERQRRDDMAAKYLVLESLLPPAPKRERATVVEDATLLVRTLQQKKAQLLKRRAELKLVQAPNLHLPRSTKKIRPSFQLHESPGTGCIKQQSAVLTALENNACKPDSPSSSAEGAILGHQEILQTERTTMSTINVHRGMEDIVVEMLWNRPPLNFQSSLLRTVENLGLEVTRCSILRVVNGFMQCFVTCSKPQVPSQLKTETLACETLIMGALRNLLNMQSS